MSRTYRNHRAKPERPRSSRLEKPFRCSRCKAMVGPVLYGGSHRNHCPYCLYSKHVDGRVPGDRAATCGGSMAPIGAFQRSNGEHVIVHHCLACSFERHNRIAADDYFDLVLSLPVLPERSNRVVKRPAREERSA